MTLLKYYDETTSTWLPLYKGQKGDPGDTPALVWGGLTGTLADQTDLQAELDAKVTPAGAQTLTNKRIHPRDVVTTSATTLTPDVSAGEMYAYTALASNLTINAPIGTPVQGDKLLFRFKDNGTSRTLTWNAIFRAVGVTLPTATTISKVSYVGAVYNAAETKWDCIAVVTEA
jgi:hypothetical protein